MANLSKQYKKQYEWRDWKTAFNAIPNLNDCTVLDIGCAIGDQAQTLAQKGARVIGVDKDDSLLEQARKRNIENTTFIKCDVTDLSTLKISKVDGIWCSFTTAYFPSLEQQLDDWMKFLKPTGWLAITEMSGLFDHAPLSEKTKSDIQKYYQYMFDKNLYDFHMGKNVENAIKALSLKIEKKILLEDKELSANGALSLDVIKAWESRLDRMVGLQNFFCDKFKDFQIEFMTCLKNNNHISHCAVYFYLLRV